MGIINKDQIRELVVKVTVGAIIGIGGSALLKLGSKVCCDAVLETINEPKKH